MTSGFGINRADSLNMQDQFLAAALKAPNINNPAYLGAQNLALNNNTATVPSATSFKGQPVDYSTTEPQKSNSALWTIGAIGATALIGCCVKGKGNPIKGGKEIYKFCKDKVNSWFSNKASKTAQMGFANGERFYTIPEKTTTIKGEKEVADFAKKYGVDLNSNRLRFEHGKSKIQKFEFTHDIKDKDGKILRSYDITFTDGKFDIVDKAGKSIKEEVSKNNADDLSAIADRVLTITTKSPTGKNINAFRNLKNLEYVNTIGDEVITITRNGGKMKVTELKTLERLKEDSDAVKEFFKNNPELQEKYSALKATDAKITEGLKVKRFTDSSIETGKTFVFEDGNVTGVEIKGRFFSKDSAKGKREIEKNKEKIEKLIKDVFEEKTAVPKTAIYTEA